jgi:uncharacterized protein (UPF0332 family)
MVNEVVAFLIKSEESLASAEQDFASSRFNSCARSSYYACFQAALAALLQAGVKPQSAKVRHEFVHGGFGELIKRRKLYASDFRDTLARNLELRHTADYQAKPISQPQAHRALQRTRAFVEHIRKGVNRV